MDPPDRFALLPVVCVALILQCLDTLDKLAAASTCTRVLADALQPLAWKHAKTIRIMDDQLIKQQTRTLPPYSVLCLAPMHLVLQRNFVKSSQLNFDCIRRLVRVEQVQRHACEIRSLLQQPVAQQIRQLKLADCGFCEAGNFSLIGKLAHLTSLDTSCFAYSKPPVALLEQLLARPQLTELALRTLSVTNFESTLQILLRSPGHLRRLHLKCGVMTSTATEALTSFGTVMPQLEVFSLGFLRIQHVPVEHMRRMFSSWKALHTLQLLCCTHIDELLALVPVIPNLRHLLLFANTELEIISRALAISTLQAAIPRLSVTTGVWYRVEHQRVPDPLNRNVNAMQIIDVSDCC
jgi:hypothetical protein